VSTGQAASRPQTNLQDPRLRTLLYQLGAATFFQGYAAALPVQLLADAAPSFGFIRDEIGPALFLIAIGSFGALLAAPLADRYGRRGLLITSTWIVAVLSALTAASPNLFMFGLFAFFARVFVVAQYATVITMLAEETPADRRGWVIGLVTAAGGIGGLTLVLVDRWIGGAGAGWRWVALTTIAGVLPALWMRSQLSESQMWAQMHERAAARLRRLPLLGRNRVQLFQIGFLFLFAYAAYFGGASWWGRYAEQERDFSDATITTLLSVSYVVGVGGYLFGGWISDLIGRRRAGTYLLIATGVFGILTFQAGDPVLALPLMIAATFCGLAVSPVISAMSAELFSIETRATSVAFVRGFFATIGGIVGPLTVGFLADPKIDIVGSIGGSVFWVSLALIPALLLLWFLPESAGRELGSLSAAARIPAPDVPVMMKLSSTPRRAEAPRSLEASSGIESRPITPTQRPGHEPPTKDD
jgi:MFS family permease